MHKLIKFPKISDLRGNLSFMQFPDQIPFAIKRVFWTYDVPGGGIRGGHSFQNQEEIIIALSGSFDVVFTDVDGNETLISLNRSYYGIYIPPLSWRHMENFSTNALALHLSSMSYSSADYIRDFESFKNMLNE